MGAMPLEGIYVVEYSAGLAGRLTGLLLADQGATVVIGRKRHGHEPLDAFLDRGKIYKIGEAPSPPAPTWSLATDCLPNLDGKAKLALR